MSNTLRYILWSIFSLGMLVLAVMAFWIFLIILGVIIIARLIYFKIFKKENKGAFTIHTYTVRPGPQDDYRYNQDRNPKSEDQEYTTVIDADDLDKEYKIPKIK